MSFRYMHVALLDIRESYIDFRIKQSCQNTAEQDFPIGLSLGLEQKVVRFFQSPWDLRRTPLEIFTSDLGKGLVQHISGSVVVYIRQVNLSSVVHPQDFLSDLLRRVTILCRGIRSPPVLV
jgi:hypothetical protein